MSTRAPRLPPRALLRPKRAFWKPLCSWCFHARGQRASFIGQVAPETERVVFEYCRRGPKCHRQRGGLAILRGIRTVLGLYSPARHVTIEPERARGASTHRDVFCLDA